MNGSMKAGLWALLPVLAFAWGGVACADYAEGYTLYKSGDLAGAMTALSAVGEGQADYVIARYLMGLCYAKQGKDAEAKAEYEAVIAKWPEYGKAYTNLARALMNLKEDQAALDAAQKGAEYAGDSGAYNTLGLAQMRFEKFDEAIASFEKSVLLDPQNAWACNNEALALIRKGEGNLDPIADKALELLKKAVELDPGNKIFKKNLDFIQKVVDSGKV